MFYKPMVPRGLLGLPGRNIGAAYGVEQRTPYGGELEYFRANPHVAGMAAEDNKIVLNPYSRLSAKELDAVKMNEASRVYMRKNPPPEFLLTPEQEQFLAGTPYKAASGVDRRATIAARLLSGDPSAGTPTREQLRYVTTLRRLLGN